MEKQESLEVMDLKLKDVLQSFRGWFAYLLRKWWIILLACILGGLAGILVAYLNKAKYESRLTFSLEGEGSSMSGALSLAAEFGLSIGGSSNTFGGDNILEILVSRRMVERTLLSVDTLQGKPVTMAEQYLSISEMNKGMEKNPRLKDIHFQPSQPRQQFSYLQDSVLFLMYESIIKSSLHTGKPDKKLNIYEVTYMSENESFSKRFVERLLLETTTFYSEIKTKRSRETLLILQRRVDSLRGSLNSSIAARASAQDANLNPAFAAPMVQTQRRQVDVSVYGAAYGELYKSLEMARYQYQKEMPLLQLIDEPNYPLRKIKMGKLKTGLIAAVVAGVLATIILLIFYPSRRNKETAAV